VFDKPSLLIFNKIDEYEKNTFDSWLDDNVKKEMMNELKEKWKEKMHNDCVFISATQKNNIDELRKILLKKIREIYKIRYPYKTEYIF
jgi:GTP-binding protein HflX